MNQVFNTIVLGLFIIAIPQIDDGSTTATVQPKQSQDVPVYSYKVIKEYPHDRNAFTQGLQFENGILYEGTGKYGESSIRQVELETGSVIQEKKLNRSFFGEGITLFQGRLIQLTWLSHTGFVYDSVSFDEIQQFSYPGEGWGITHNDSQLIMSDGTDVIRFLDPDTFEESHTITVTLAETPVSRLNELEYINGEIYANVWMSDIIVRINPENGNVTSFIDLKGLLEPAPGFPIPDVLNGIAYDKEQDRLFVTGKNWPSLFHIELVPQHNSINDWKKRD